REAAGSGAPRPAGPGVLPGGARAPVVTLAGIVPSHPAAGPGPAPTHAFRRRERRRGARAGLLVVPPAATPETLQRAADLGVSLIALNRRLSSGPEGHLA